MGLDAPGVRRAPPVRDRIPDHLERRDVARDRTWLAAGYVELQLARLHIEAGLIDLVWLAMAQLEVKGGQGDSDRGLVGSRGVPGVHPQEHRVALKRRKRTTGPGQIGAPRVRSGACHASEERQGPDPLAPQHLDHAHELLSTSNPRRHQRGTRLDMHAPRIPCRASGSDELTAQQWADLPVFEFRGGDSPYMQLHRDRFLLVLRMGEYPSRRVSPGRGGRAAASQVASSCCR